MSELTRETIATAAELSSRLTRVSRDIDRIVAEMSRTTQTSGTYWKGIESRLKIAYEEARKIAGSWVASKLPKRFNSALSRTIRDIKARTIKPPNVVDYKAFVNSLKTRQSLASMLSETMSSLNSGFLSGETTLLRLSRATQQVLLSEAKINKAVERGFIESGSAGGSKRKLMDALMAKAADGKYVTIVDKNGNTRQYTVDAYAELVARSKLVEASSQAVITTAAAVGADLVQVSTHNTKCEQCSEFEGKIYSVSGSDSDFPQLEEEPPYHPNCEHSLTIVYKEALARDGTLDKCIGFSNGDIAEHPTRAGFIPVAERELS